LSPEAVEAALLEIGASSITFVDRGDEPVLEPKPGEVRLWSDTLVRALFEASCGSGSGSADAASAESASTDAARNLGRLAAVLGPHITETARVRRVENQEWERVWLTDWKSMRFGRRLWVCPTAAEPPDDPNAVVVRLDPGLAFGTGTHPTTALCLQILDSLPVAGRSVIDYGCGSGILGVAALKLGRRPRVRGRSGPPGAARNARQRDPKRRFLEHRRAGHRSRLEAGVLCHGQYSCGPVGRIGADTDGSLRAGRILASVGTAEDTGLRGESRLRLRF